MDSIIKAENLSFSYSRHSSESAQQSDEPAQPGGETPVYALNGLNLEIERGTFTAIIGHNGSGKTTLAKHFNAILLPGGGKVFADSMDTADESLLLEIRRRVGMVFQNPDNQIVATIVEEDVAFAPENLGYPPPEIRKRVDEALEVVGMSGYSTHAPHLLSGGQKQRIAIAGVLAMRPECIVFDEPTAMLDPCGQESVLNIMRGLPGALGITVVLITHNMDEAASADRVIVMADGSIIKDGAPREVFLEIDMLRDIGLDIPETSLLLSWLKDDGLDLPAGALTVEECAQAICRALGGKG